MSGAEHETCHEDAHAALAPEHAMFEPFVGTFKAEVKMYMGPGEPMVMTGVMVNEPDLGGRFLKQTYTGDACDGPFPDFEGRGYWGYNTATKKFEGFWVDNASTFFQVETGSGDGKSWEMLGELVDPSTGKPMRKKSVIEVQDNDRHTMSMAFDMGDGNWNTAMEIAYVRA